MEPTRIAHYELGRMLGRGGMGEVYEATDVTLGRRVALKFLAPELVGDDESVTRFEREARTAAALAHPHIATLYAFEHDGGRRFLAMELLPGETLRRRLREGPLPGSVAVGLARDVADALAHAHAAGIVHRDIKPENLMFDGRGAIKVTDFGLARALEAARLTMTGAATGTASYMAPEAIRGEVGTAADVFSLGIVLHEMLTGALPFTGDGPLATLYAIANHAPEPLRARLPDAPQALVDALAAALEKDPARRCTAAALAAALAPLAGAPLPSAPAPATRPAGAITEDLEVTRVAHRDTGPVDETSPTAAIQLPAPRPLVSLPVTRRRSLAPVLGAALAALLAVAAFLAWNGSRAAARRDALAANNRGIAELAAGRLDGAEAAFRHAIARDGRYAKAYLNLGMVALRRGRTAEAESLYLLVLDHARAARADSAAAWAQLAALDMDAGAWPSAVTNLQRSFALDSSAAAAWGNLAFALVMEHRPGEALALANRALARFPDEPMLQKTAGLAALRLERADEAESHLARAVALAPSLAVARGLHARALAALGRRADAAAEWRAYDALAPDAAARAQVGEGPR